MDLTYAVADLHGADDLLDLALMAMDRHAAAAPAGARTVVLLGDYIDRGSGSRAILERLKIGPPDGWHWHCLRGNHEDMMLRAFADDDAADLWLSNGGEATLAYYPDDGDQWAVPDAHLAWLEALPLFHADRHRVFVHAGVAPIVALNQQSRHQLLWSRASNQKGHDERFVVHGHVPHADGPVTSGRSIDLDTLAWKTGRLVIGVFDDGREGGPAGLIEIHRSPI